MNHQNSKQNLSQEHNYGFRYTNLSIMLFALRIPDYAASALSQAMI